MELLSQLRETMKHLRRLWLQDSVVEFDYDEIFCGTHQQKRESYIARKPELDNDLIVAHSAVTSYLNEVRCDRGYSLEVFILETSITIEVLNYFNIFLLTKYSTSPSQVYLAIRWLWNPR